MEYIQNHAETIIALCALVVSAISILIGYFSLKSQQKHNRLSVRPIGKIHFITVRKRIEIEIRNDGIGPMICSSVKVYQNESDTKTNFRDAMPILQHSKYSVECYSAGSNFTIRAGDQKAVLKVYSDELTPEYLAYRNEVLAEMEKFTLEVEYRDMYGQHIETLRRNMWKT